MMTYRATVTFICQSAIFSFRQFWNNLMRELVFKPKAVDNRFYFFLHEFSNLELNGAFVRRENLMQVVEVCIDFRELMLFFRPP